ncbi:uncharacterized protein LOC133295217 [Gastrolobium bilobum]|uniref:uncharacterized protein LOC133295217 n=1 Tax=Gastrolobium bilobum TaxID=150636 RepID=UPI002AB08ABB|nr:uncharacterized protein LOC133295217 [Gastrolobium bilobum]
MTKVLASGPYFIFQRPLLLKVMPPLFMFGSKELSKIPVWVQLKNLPLELWNPMALGKILSKVGTPIRTDQLTASMQSVSFARALVEVDVAVDMEYEVRCRLPDGSTFFQSIEYESLPSFCDHCKMTGHNVAKCKSVPKKIDPIQQPHPEANPTHCDEEVPQIVETSKSGGLDQQLVTGDCNLTIASCSDPISNFEVPGEEFTMAVSRIRKKKQKDSISLAKESTKRPLFKAGKKNNNLSPLCAGDSNPHAKQ